MAKIDVEEFLETLELEELGIWSLFRIKEALEEQDIAVPKELEEEIEVQNERMARRSV